MLVRSVWLGVLEAKRPELCPVFFEVDLAPFILNFMSRHDGGCRYGEWMKISDCILYTVHLWFAPFLPLLLAVKALLFVDSYYKTFTVEPPYWVPPPHRVPAYKLAIGDDYFDEWPMTWIPAPMSSPTLTPHTSTAFYMDFVGKVPYYDSSDNFPPLIISKLRFTWNGFVHIVLASSMTVFLFCLYGSRVFWSEGFIKGELSQHDTSRISRLP